MLIGVCGLIGSGKDTVAGILKEQFGFEKDAFAGTLKDVTSSLFAWDREVLEGATPENRKKREVVDEWWTEKFGYPVTMRNILQKVGTEVVRNNLHNDMWVLSLERRVMPKLENGKHIVITDARFPNELAAIARLGGEIIEIHRGPPPDWYNRARHHNHTLLTTGASPVTIDEIKTWPHESEWRWIGNGHIQHHIYNNYDLEYLASEVTSVVENILDN